MKYMLIFIGLLYISNLSTQIRYTASFETDEIKIGEIKGEDGFFYSDIYHEFRLMDGNIGSPKLPVKYFHFSVPSEANNFSITIENIRKEDLTLKYKVLPVQPPVPTGIYQNYTEFTPPDEKIYKSSSVYPSAPVIIAKDGFADGDKHILTVAVSPITYYPTINRIEINRQISFKINYSVLKSTGKSNKKILSRTFENKFSLFSIEQMVENPKDVVKNKSIIQPLNVASNIGLPYYEYCIITTRLLSKSFERLVAWKRAKGLDAGIICIEDILSNPYITGDLISRIYDDAGKIRQYLTYAYEYGNTSYVLFGGNDRILPIRHGAGWENTWDRPDEINGAKVPADLYFSDLNGNWNVDGDQYYGESYGDDIDFQPELYVGRILCNNTKEVNNYITKLIKYERNPGNGTYAYLKKSFYTQSDQLQSGRQAQQVASTFNDILPESNAVIFEEEPGAYTQQDPTYPTGKQVIDEINRRYGFIGWLGHSGADGTAVATYGTNKAPRYAVVSYEEAQANWAYTETGNGLDNMTNDNYPAITYSIGCTTTPFDEFGNNDHTRPISHNMGESYTTKGLYGGPAYLGYTRVGWVAKGYRLMQYFAEQIKSGNYKIGVAEANSKASYSSHWEALAHNLVGCPEFEMWTNIPSKFNTVAINSANSNLTVNTNVAGSNIHACGIFSGKFIQKHARGNNTNFTGMPQNYLVSVLKHDYIPYIAPIYAQNEQVTGSHYIYGDKMYFGSNVDPNRTSGDLIIKSGAEVILESNEEIVFDKGFQIEIGGTLEIRR